MPVITPRVVPGPEPFIHILWAGDPKPTFAPAKSTVQLSLPHGDTVALKGWKSSSRHDFPGGTSALILQPGKTSNVAWIKPGAVVEFVFNSSGGDELGRTQAVVDALAADSPDSTRIADGVDSANVNVFLAEGRESQRSGMADLVGFPLGVFGTSTDTGSGSSAATSAQTVVDMQMRQVLGRKPSPDDVTGTLAMLDRSMQRTEVDGIERWDLRPGGATVIQADTGAGVTGRQASVAGLARDTLEQLEPLVQKVRPLAPRTDNPVLVEAFRRNFLASFKEAVAEAGVPGGPVRGKADILLQQSREQLGRFGVELGVVEQTPAGLAAFRDNVITPEDEEQYTTFLVIVDRYRVFDDFFRAYLDLPTDGDPGIDVTQSRTQDFGLRFTLLDRRIDIIAEAVDELDAALASVGIDRQEREAIAISMGDDGTDNPTLADFMAWAQHFAANEARPLIQGAGVAGAALLPGRLLKLLETARALDDTAAGSNGSGPAPGIGHPRVRIAIAKLRDELGKARQQAIDAAGLPPDDGNGGNGGNGAVSADGAQAHDPAPAAQ
jgi:hypothetical protein